MFMFPRSSMAQPACLTHKVTEGWAGTPPTHRTTVFTTSSMKKKDHKSPQRRKCWLADRNVLNFP